MKNILRAARGTEPLGPRTDLRRSDASKESA